MPLDTRNAAGCDKQRRGGSDRLLADFTKLIIKLFHRLRNHPGVGDHGHEVGIPRPARHDVLVKVAGNPRAAQRPWLMPILKPCGLMASCNSLRMALVCSVRSACSPAVRSW